MAHDYSLAYLTSSTCTAVESIRLAAQLGYRFVGLRLLANTPGGEFQALVGDAALLREVRAAQQDTGVGVLDLEIVRIGTHFDVRDYLAFFETGAALGARCVLVAGDDTNAARLAANYASLCERMAPFGLSADLEFMPWTAVTDARAALGIVNAAGSPENAGILVDALHFDRSGTSLQDVAAIPRDLLHYAQICDAPTRAQWGRPFTTEEMIHTARLERWLPGEGGIDLGGMFGVLPSTLPVSVEIPHAVRLPAAGQQEWARQALAASRAQLEPRA